MKLSTEVYTPYVDESREFYCDTFGFTVKTGDEGYVVLQHRENPGYELMFCVPGSPFVNELFHPPFCGTGILFQIEVDDVRAEYERIKRLSVPISLPLTEEPVNGCHFTVSDPNGILVDVVQFSPES